MDATTTITLPVPTDTLLIIGGLVAMGIVSFAIFTFLPRSAATDGTTPLTRLANALGFGKRSPFQATLLTLVLLFYLLIFIMAALIALRTLGGILLVPSPEVAAPTQPRAGLAFGTLLAAILGAPFIVWRTTVAVKQTAVAEESLFNDKINAAATDLAARRQVTRVVGRGSKTQVLTEWQDDLVTRAAAIDRLEGLALERPDVAPRIARMLSIYVQELSRDPAHAAKPAPEFEDRAQMRAWAATLRPIQRTDMERAVQSLGRINPKNAIARAAFDPKNIDLRHCNLQGFDLNRLNFQGCQLAGAKMQGAMLFDAQLQGANLFEAQMQEAALDEAQMQGASLYWAQMQGANLFKAQMQGAKLFEAQMQGANLFKAQMQGAGLDAAQMQGATLYGVKMQGADLRGAQMTPSTELTDTSLRGVAVSFVDDTTLTQLKAHDDWDQMFHPDASFDYNEFDREWRAFAAALDPPVTIAPDYNRTD